MIDLKHPLAVLSTRLPWAAIEAAVAPKLGRQTLPTKRLRGEDLLGAYDVEFGGRVSPAGRPRLPIRLMASLLYLKNSFNLSDEELVERWAENVQSKAIAHPVDSRLLEIARHKVVGAATSANRLP